MVIESLAATVSSAFLVGQRRRGLTPAVLLSRMAACALLITAMIGVLGGTAWASYPYWQVDTSYSGYTALNLRTAPSMNAGVMAASRRVV